MRGSSSPRSAELPARAPWVPTEAFDKIRLASSNEERRNLLREHSCRLDGARDDDPVGREVESARERALEAALATFAGDDSPAAEVVRQQFEGHLRRGRAASGPEAAASRACADAHQEVHRLALAEARRVVFDMRTRDDIGDDAFHRLEEEFDWIEMGIGARGELEGGA